MGLLWNFIGFSQGYNFFAGAGELLGGILLATRRTTLLGALITLGVASHVAVLNLCYDVPVKLLSLHLVILTIILILPDAKRLIDFFILNRPATPVEYRPLVRWRWLNVAGGILGTLWLATFLGWSLWEAYSSRTRRELGNRSPLYGVWEVESLTTDGKDRPPLTTDIRRWQRVVFDNPQFLIVQRMDGSRIFFQLKLDEAAKTMEWTNSPRGVPEHSMFHYDQPAAHALTLDGKLVNETIHAGLRRTKTDFFLTTRGFHWINEIPLNR
jgi:hypothetical protein